MAELTKAGTRFEIAPDGAAPVAAPSAASPGAPRCGLETALKVSLTQDQTVLSALARIPRQARSVANAVMLWDGRWANPAELGGDAALYPIREAIQKSVALASEACKREVLRGPVLIAVLSRPETTIIAVGSGAWRWSDLLDPTPR